MAALVPRIGAWSTRKPFVMGLPSGWLTRSWPPLRNKIIMTLQTTSQPASSAPACSLGMNVFSK
jgi:hypothetical protein